MECKKCKRKFEEVIENGIYFQRTNPTGEEGIWGCNPYCNAKQTQEDALLQALEYNENSQ